MTSGKILGPDDIAKRAETAIVRAVRILMDIRQQEGDLYEQVRHSRFVTNAGNILAAELEAWGFDPERDSVPPVRSSDTGVDRLT